MSNESPVLEEDGPAAPGCGAIEFVLQPRQRDLGGFSVRRLLPTARRKMVGPWIFFDHLGPVDLPPGKGFDVRPHPHIGLATVTYLFEGEVLHRDSLGSLQRIHPGDINLMVAGRGIVHSERERPERTAQARRLHGLQLWFALPEADEEMEPLFLHYPSAVIPRLQVGGVSLRVMMSEAYGVVSPVRSWAGALYVEAQLEAGQKLLLPEAAERALYVAEGELSLRDVTLPEHSLAILDATLGVEIEAVRATRIALVGGEPLGRRFIDWNFVSSRRERIGQARQDWQAGRFPQVPGDENEFMPLPE